MMTTQIIQHLPEQTHTMAFATPSQHTDQINFEKRVSFAPQPKIQLVELRTEYSFREAQSCWYSQKEFSKIKSETNATLLRIEKNQEIDEETCSIRGLEQHTKNGAKAIAMERSNALTAVLDEARSGTLDEELLADIYIECCRQSKMWAYLRGLADQRAASDIAEGRETPKLHTQKGKQNKPVKQQRRWFQSPLSGRYSQ